MSPSVTYVEGLFGALMALLNGIGFFIVHRLNKKKFAAEVEKLQAESNRIEAETDDLVSARLIRELDRLTESNRLQGEEIERLRAQVISYATKEAIHAAENAALKLRIKELEEQRQFASIGNVLDQAFPLPITHTPNEFDQEN